MKLSNFDFHLPPALIASAPVRPRDHSRLLVLDKISGKIEHRHFYDLPDYLQKGDVLVLNNSKVFPARLLGKKKNTGGKIEVFLLKKDSLAPIPPLRGVGGEVWQCLLGGKGRAEGLEIEINKNLRAEAIKDNQDGTWQVRFNRSGRHFMDTVEKIGCVPLPPYIKRKDRARDRQAYQTVYAEKSGSVAAPTAGLHFTPRLLKKLKAKGVQIEHVTLHVGLGTFAAVKHENIEEHKMHAEYIEIGKSTAQRISKAKKEGRRIIAVGTTSVRTLESLFVIRDSRFAIDSLKMSTDIFIYPGYRFKIVNCLITNFHIPKSSLLMLVSALAGKEKIDRAYRAAKRRKYRFYSYGDAMLIV